MKIAYLIAGHTKFYEKCLSSHSRINNILTDNNNVVDCFISTYNKSGKLQNNTKFHNLTNNKDCEIYNKDDEYISIDLLNNFFNPKLFSLEVETEYSKKLPYNFERITSENNSSFYHINRLYKKFIDTINLMERYENENDFKYDFFVRTRFDLNIEIENFYFDDYLHGIPSSDDFHDVFFYGNRDFLNKFKKIDGYLNKIFTKHLAIKKSEEDKNKSIRIPYRNSEDLLTNFLKEEDVKYKIDNIHMNIFRT